ncbi:caspase family protein [Streptomyces sp. NPDC050803]|uniref:caspase family protein n=1 Tax=unclassified Streptomyces TaxID=2593676 RepID=UPI0034251894
MTSGVETLVDARNHEVKRAIEKFFRDRRRNDVLLLHLSCHGIKDDQGELYFAAGGTDLNLLGSTAVEAAFLRAQMSRCWARSVVLLLDCCYSGAFLPGSKGDRRVHLKDELAGHGRVVLTATNRAEFAWEGTHLSELEPEQSHFTGAVIEGLRSGEADGNHDGLVTHNDLYEYVYERMQAASLRQRPQMWADVQFRVVIARAARLLGGRYAMGELIGRGGMAAVHRARDTRLDRTVAVKRMHAALAQDVTQRYRFHRAAEAALVLSHPEIVSVYQAVVTLVRAAAPAFAEGLLWSAGERALCDGVAAARALGRAHDVEYFEDELGVLDRAW